jgi:hypothetical protein
MRTAHILGVLSIVAMLPATSALQANSLSTVAPGMAGGEYRLVANLDPAVGGAGWLESQRPLGATHYTASFLFDPSGIQMTPGGSAVRFLNAIDENVDGSEPYAATISVGFVQLKTDNHWWIHFWNYQDTGGYASANTSVDLGTVFPVEVKIEFTRGGVGQTTWCAERTDVPASRVCATHLAMANADVDGLRIGAFANGNPGGWTGSMSFDEFESSW